MSSLITTTDFISTKIYFLRGEKILLDADLALLYGVEVKRLKEAARRNIERFPEDFMFELTTDEWQNLRTQIASSSWGGQRYPPFAFTEQGVAMLSGVLKSPRAIETNIAIMRTFVAIRRWMASNKNLLLKSNNWKVNTMNSSVLSSMLSDSLSLRKIKNCDQLVSKYQVKPRRKNNEHLL